MVKIDNKIVGYAVKAPSAEEEKTEKPEFKRESRGDGAEVIRMHEKLERPEVLIGSTYKVKTPISDHAMYVTINDIVIRAGNFNDDARFPVSGIDNNFGGNTALTFVARTER